MKTMRILMAVLAAVVLLGANVALAASISGTVVAVDGSMSELQVSTDQGTSYIAFSAETAWPEGVTDPASLAGKSVSITTDDESGKALAVALA
jgi:hypothetical protein